MASRSIWNRSLLASVAGTTRITGSASSGEDIDITNVSLAFQDSQGPSWDQRFGRRDSAAAFIHACE
jgi:hypothetical protein